MAKHELYAPFAGVKDGLTLLTLLMDKKKLVEMLGVLKGLEGTRNQVNEAIETYGKAKKMAELLRQAEAKNMEADKTLRDATANSETVRAEAKYWAAELVKKSKTREADVKQREDAVEEGERRRCLAEAQFVQERKIAEAKIATDEQAATKRLEEANALQSRYQKILDDMKAQAAAA